MSEQKRRAIASGIILILLGLAFLAFEVVPGLRTWANLQFTWPISILIVALFFVLLGAATGNADLLVPACIVGGIGGILYLQNAGSVTWESWAYLWTLLPGFAGVGVALAGLLKWKPREIVDGLQTILVSAVLFAVFGSLLGGLFGFFPFQAYLPILLILLGVFLFIRALLDRRKA